MSTNCDIISVNLGKRVPFYWEKSPIKQAILRGAQFEINYGLGMLENSSENRKRFLQNAMSLVKVCKGKNLIMGSETNQRVFMRSPLDI